MNTLARMEGAWPKLAGLLKDIIDQHLEADDMEDDIEDDVDQEVEDEIVTG
jgi:hypothetical protein